MKRVFVAGDCSACTRCRLQPAMEDDTRCVECRVTSLSFDVGRVEFQFATSVKEILDRLVTLEALLKGRQINSLYSQNPQPVEGPCTNPSCDLLHTWHLHCCHE